MPFNEKAHEIRHFDRKATGEGVFLGFWHAQFLLKKILWFNYITLKLNLGVKR
ncbi:hypothetical protein HpBGD65_14840 [Helicobacter pylori]